MIGKSRETTGQRVTKPARSEPVSSISRCVHWRCSNTRYCCWTASIGEAVAHRCGRYASRTQAAAWPRCEQIAEMSTSGPEKSDDDDDAATVSGDEEATTKLDAPRRRCGRAASSTPARAHGSEDSDARRCAEGHPWRRLLTFEMPARRWEQTRPEGRAHARRDGRARAMRGSSSSPATTRACSGKARGRA